MAVFIGSEDGDAGFQIVPMADVVFVLLLFFMASAGTQSVEKELAVQLLGRPPHAKDRVLESLRLWIKTDVTDFGGSLVIIRPSSETRHERIIDVLDALSASGMTKLTFG